MTTAQRLTFEQYLKWDNGTEKRYELVDGRLIELPPESEPNTSLANFLFLQLCQCWATVSSDSTLRLRASGSGFAAGGPGQSVSRPGDATRGASRTHPKATHDYL